MASIVDRHREELEARGEYVVLANTSWFAVFPATLRDRIEQSRSEGRAGPNLIVYQTRSRDPRHHYVIPFALVREILVDETLSDSAAGGQRWNLTLDDGMLHISHRAGKIDVARFRGLPLLIEDTSIAPEAFEPTADPIQLEERVRRLRRLPSLERPTGRQVPAKRAPTSRTTYERRPDVKAWVLLQAKGQCELCQRPAPFVGDDGEPFLELHHVHQLADRGPDTVENAVAVCPSCHRHLHHGADRVAQRERLYQQVSRLVRTTREVEA